jgi:hypothetical protein
MESCPRKNSTFEHQTDSEPLQRTAKVHVTDTDNTRLTTDVEAGRMRSLLFKFVPDADEYADAGGVQYIY